MRTWQEEVREFTLYSIIREETGIEAEWEAMRSSVEQLIEMAHGRIASVRYDLCQRERLMAGYISWSLQNFPNLPITPRMWRIMRRAVRNDMLAARRQRLFTKRQVKRFRKLLKIRGPLTEHEAVMQALVPEHDFFNHPLRVAQ